MSYYDDSYAKNPSRIVDTVKPKNHSGFVYVKVGEEAGVPIYEMRKPDPFERKCIVENYIRVRSKDATQGKDGNRRYFLSSLPESDYPNITRVIKMIKNNNPDAEKYL